MNDNVHALLSPERNLVTRANVYQQLIQHTDNSSVKESFNTYLAWTCSHKNVTISAQVDHNQVTGKNIKKKKKATLSLYIYKNNDNNRR